MNLRIDANLKVPLHHQIESGILSLIRGGGYRPGDLLFTEVGLGQKYGVSLGPVRQAVNSLVAKGILERRRAKGVFLVDAEGEKPLKHRITFVTPDISHSFYGSMVRGGEHCARERGYEITIANSDFDSRREAAILAQLAGMDPHIIVLCTNGGKSCHEEVERLIKQGFIVVMIDRHFPDLKIDVVENDNYRMGRDAVEYLVKLGHRRIVHATNDVSMGLNIIDRNRGYEQAMLESGLTPETFLVTYPGGKWDVEIDEQVTRAYLEQCKGNLPTAIFVISDTLCIGVIRGIKRLGLSVPDDISVMGCADLDFARMLSEPLTTINQDSYGMGHRGVMLGIERLEGQGSREPAYEVQPHRIIERMTTRDMNESKQKSEKRLTV